MTDDAPHRKRLKRYNTPGHAHFLTFSTNKRMPLLTNDLWRTWLAEGIRESCDDFEFALWAYVFMPEHVHLLVKPRREKYDVAQFLKPLKENFAKRLVGALAEQKSPLLARLTILDRPGKTVRRVWQEGGGYDKNIWSMEKAAEKARYCHWNPVKRGLVKSPEQWRWSSYRWLELGRRADEPLRVDDWDERIIEGPAASVARSGADGLE